MGAAAAQSGEAWHARVAVIDDNASGTSQQPAFINTMTPQEHFVAS